MKAIDLFCGGGGSTIGLMQAGFEVTGIDIKDQPNYPGHQFIKANVLDMPINIFDFDIIVASPPCKQHSIANRANNFNYKKHRCYISEVRELIKKHPFYVIENVPLAPLRTSLILTGQTFGLKKLWRKRHFETSFIIRQPELGNRPKKTISVTTSMCSNNHFYRRKALGLPGRPPLWVCHSVMGFPRWTYSFYPRWALLNYVQIGNAVPPPYMRHIAEEMKKFTSTEKTEKSLNFVTNSEYTISYQANLNRPVA